MKRVRIEFPRELTYTVEEKVRVGDLNYGNHLGNDAVLSLVHQARMEFLGSFGWSEMDMGGLGLIMTDSMIEYKSEGFFGERLKIKVGFGDHSRVGFDLYYLIEKEGGVILAKAKTGMICYDYQLKKVCSIPEEVLQIIQKGK